MSDLDRLKELLFGAEKQALDSITQRVARREDRAVDVADILPEAIHTSHKSGNELVDSLRKPVGECVQQEFQDDPKTYSDALYPVIGPAIRKSIMQALRTFAEQINTAVEQSLTPRGLAWRFQAARAGVPFGEFVLQKTLLYRVEQAYLISRENGLLIGHVHHEAAKIKDSDAVSAMFTAIQDFVQDSFSPDRTGRLESADMGEFTLWAMHGPHALLVCVIRGVPPRALRAELSAILERVHFRYGDAIRTYAGDASTVPEVGEELDKCLRFQARQMSERNERRISLPLLILMFAVAGLLLYVGVSRWLHSQALNRLIEAIQATPGIYLSEGFRRDDRFVLRGMRDPLAPRIADIAASVGLDAGDIEVDLRAFQSLDPDMVARRAARAVGNPAGITFQIDGRRLIVTGPVPIELQRRIRDAVPLLAGIDAVHIVVDPAAREKLTRELLEPPDSVSLESVAAGVIAKGSAPAGWIQSAALRVADANLAWDIDLSGISASERQMLLADLAALDNRNFYFLSGTTFERDEQEQFSAYAANLRDLSAMAATLGENLQIQVHGFADGIGNPATNRRLATQRAERAADLLTAAGLDPVAISVRAIPASQLAGNLNPELRRVTIELELVRAGDPE